MMTNDTGMVFAVDPGVFILGDARARAVADVATYFESYTGSWFERLADTDSPSRITEKDIVAVSTLAVDVPAPTVIWLLNDGAPTVEGLLAQISPSQTLWDDAVDITREGPAWRLWDAIREGGWPRHRGGMGTATTSKLLATKRPHLVPLQDSVVTTLLGRASSSNYWRKWQARLSGPGGDELRAAAVSIRDEIPEAAHLSVLRVLDIVLWMEGDRQGLASRRW